MHHAGPRVGIQEASNRWAARDPVRWRRVALQRRRGCAVKDGEEELVPRGDGGG